jgi:hypothetical protein
MSCPEPVSWLRLERRAAGDLDVREGAAIDQHLASCEECASAANTISGWSGRLRPLPAVTPRRRWEWWLLAPAAAAALVLLWPRRDDLVAVKGSDVALTLVREHAGEVDLDPTIFAPGDRVKLLVTCPAPHLLAWDVAVFQGGAVSFPFRERAPVPCANRVPLPGALQLDGRGPVTICLTWGSLDRARLMHEREPALPPQSRCERLTPQPPP